MSGSRVLFVAAAALASSCAEPPAPNPWARWHTKGQVRDLVRSCGTSELPRSATFHDYEVRYTVEAEPPYEVFCRAIWDDETSRLAELYVSIFGPHDMQVTQVEILPVAEFVLRELPPEPRAIARRVATHRTPPLTVAKDHVTVGAFTIGGGVSSGMWNLHVGLAR